MNALLMNLPYSLDSRNDFGELLQPFGLASISAVLKKDGYNATLCDAWAHRMLRGEVVDYIADLRPDVIGFTTYTYNLAIVASILPEIRQILPETKIVLGGPHATVESSSTLEYHPEVDICVIGEGEYIFPEILDSLREGRSLNYVPGIHFREEGEIIKTCNRPAIKNLDLLPYADWDSLPMEEYFANVTTHKNYVKLMASRGCPFACTFCGVHETMGKKLRKRSPKHFVGEIQLLYEKHGVRDFGFGDSVFNIDNKWVVGVCEEILKLDYPIRWRCNVFARLVKKETINLMKRAGCQHVTMGVESGDPHMLTLIKKGETLDHYRDAVDIIKQEKLPLLTSWIIGMPGETPESIENSLRFAKELKVHVGFNIANPYPGTDFYGDAINDGWSIQNWSKLNVEEITYVPSGLTKEQLQKAYRKVVLSFYLDPGILFLYAKEIKTLLALRIHLRSLWRLLMKLYRNMTPNALIKRRQYITQVHGSVELK